MKIIVMLSIAILGVTGNLLAQETQKYPIKISGYAEVYYQHDFSNPLPNQRSGFIYSHNRNNEINLNLGLLKASYETEKIRSNIGIATGTYMNANYAAEEGVLKNIYEANIGVRLSEKQQIWLDAGILPSHIGAESAIGLDCFTLTRSIMAENSPYFETGAKLSYLSTDNKWQIAVLVLNGWQRIQKLNGNSLPAFGHQLVFKPTPKVTLNSSSYIGNEKPDAVRQMRYFHNLYAQFELSPKFSLIAVFDIGAEQKNKNTHQFNMWYSPAVMAKYSLSQKLNVAARLEYYNDKKQVMIATGSENGFQTFGSSINADYWITPALAWRVELKNLRSKDRIFTDRDEVLQKNNFLVATSLAVKF
ncbi:porin [Pedobacter sp.]|uniref:porin n=1 Tax=Pedobacter sp. TaxID=1411316 RepID=UPI00396CF24B